MGPEQTCGKDPVQRPGPIEGLMVCISWRPNVLNPKKRDDTASTLGCDPVIREPKGNMYVGCLYGLKLPQKSLLWVA